MFARLTVAAIGSPALLCQSRLVRRPAAAAVIGRRGAVSFFAGAAHATRRWCSSGEGGASTPGLSEKDLIELNKEAANAFETGDYLAAIAAWEKVVQSKQHTPNSPTLMNSLNNLACAYGEMGDNVRKLKLLERSLDLVRAVYGADHPQYGMVLYNMACAKEEMGFYADMKQLLEESLALHEKRFNPRHAKVGRVLLLLAAAHGHLGEREAQLRVAERAHEIVKRHCGPDHVQTTVAMMNLGRAYGAAGNVERQLQLAQAAYSIQERQLGPMNPQLAMTLLEVAEAHRVNGDHYNQKALLEQAVELQQRSFGQQHTHLVDTYIALGDACGHLGNTKLQGQYYLEALKIARHRYQGRHIAIGRAAVHAALAYLLQGNKAKADALLQEARSVVQHNVSPEHPLAKKLEEVAKDVTAA
ncbi:TPR repeat/Tetratricopeptide repeat [Novymonas esmeraldas]|uniref:TPR repeat/Tetratricopeptide repeat n=1 Tax=Novymonas esmeraldas TaxID=1808958 RepID=A0AAW0EYG7_9TRYP